MSQVGRKSGGPFDSAQYTVGPSAPGRFDKPALRVAEPPL